MLLCCESDTAYGPHLIRRISEKSALAVEIDLTWSLGFVSVELSRLLTPLSCKTLLIYPICISKERIEKTKRSKNDQKQTRNEKKTKSQEQDEEISQKSQPDQPDTVKLSQRKK
ncbi:hypothetical protein Tco_0472893 [Tanacetum coccineum]